MRREVTPDVVRHIDLSTTEEGLITFTELNEANAEEVIRKQVAYFERIGQDFEWKLYDYDQPLNLKERLEAFGFTIEEAEAIMVLDLENTPEILWQPVRHYIKETAHGRAKQEKEDYPQYGHCHQL